MKRIRQGWNTLRRNSRSGVSLIVALCAVAVLIGLSLSIVYSSSMLLARANRKIGRERCYQLAQSFAEVLDDELRAYDTERSDIGADEDRVANPDDSTFYTYANSVLENFPVYDPDNPDETTFRYTTGTTDGEYGKVTVTLRSIDTKDAENPANEQYEFAYENRSTETVKIESRTFLHYQLSVGVTVELGADSYTYTTQYNREDGYEPVYTWQSETGSAFQVYWQRERGEFSRDNDGSDIVYPGTVGEDENAHQEIVTIAYRYNPDKMTYKKYTPVQNVDGGDSDG